MKSKILFSTLFGGALLAACTADDAFDVNKVAEKANVAAPTFTVSFDKADDDVLTRADMGNSSMTWEEGDKMSLYHGGTDASGDFFTVPAYTRNAIYVSKAGAEGKSEFSTQAMVLPGTAIMIYPADTEMLDRTGKNPIVTIPTEQNKETRNQTPYVSEVLEITDDQGHLNDTDENGNLKNPHSAGYGRNYDIVMRRLGAMLRLSLEATGTSLIEEAGVPAVEFKKVSFDVTGASPFTTAIELKVGQLRGQTNEDGTTTDTRVGTNTVEHKYWKYSPWIEPQDDATSTTYKSSTISTTDVRTNPDNNLPTAYFTLLPPEDRNASVLSMEKDKDDVKDVNAFRMPTFTSTKITVLTNYGTVELTDAANVKEEEEGLWKKGANRMTMNNGLAEFLTVAFDVTAETDKNYELYKNQLAAGKGTRLLSVDLSNLNMNGLHIQTEQDLINVEKVLQIVGVKGTDNVFYLDGDDKGEFTIESPEAYEAYNKIITYADGKEGVDLKLVPCEDKGEECKLIVLKNVTDGGDVPATLKFGKKTATNKVLVQLGNGRDAENWTLDGSHTFVGVDSLVVAPTTTLELKGTVNNLNPAAAKNATTDLYVATTALVNRPDGTINVNSDVTLQLNTRNYGEINVGDENSGTNVNEIRLRLSSLGVKDMDQTTSGTDPDKMITLVNENYGSEYKYGMDDTESKGVIKVYTRLGILGGTNGRIYNFGYIETKSASSAVLLYANATETTTGTTKDADITKPFKNEACGAEKIADLHKGDNIFGVLKVSNDADVLALTNINSDAHGFVEYDAGSGNAMASPGGLVNYVKGGSFASSGKVTYSELYPVGKTLTVADNLGTLIVPKGVTLSVVKDKTLSVTNIYLAGEVYYAGTFTATNYETYMGGSDNDKYNATFIGN